MSTTSSNSNKVEFQICVANSAQDLASAVTDLLNNGWRCQGGVHTYQDLYPRFCQSMVREEQPARPTAKSCRSSQTTKAPATAEE